KIRTGEAETLPWFFLVQSSLPCPRPVRRSAYACVLCKGGKQFSWTFMRLLCGLAMALWLSFPVAGMASWRQDPAGSANSAGQAPAAPAAPAEKARTEPAPPEQVPAE